ncbi:ATP synthase F1 subcomplex delta subunit [Desulfitobacterium dichloroeliminans LMG P-21439]|uniref:ATP synthase subunit delta n=1 Tax=Desulfitobacterium dichloroeliminans (strain LMG P-21439 / DCA1) TaxID=871963 RepID=L0FC77_DESDL|nr:F0F1 ATP synthase subunit delta [Desulfitobacterium dichloroeliminans]AGA70827.1 ATP synthase F1 subcomplex delta subunit [Desulfitobacterium dichloroeliminans LMG P-21439]
MLKGAIAHRYAQALFEIALQGNLDAIEAELQELTQLFEQNAEVAHVLYHPHISLSVKKDLMRKIFAGELSVTVGNFLNLLIDRRRQNYLPDIAQEFTRLADGARNVVEAKVTSAVPLNDIQEQRLQKELARITGKNVRMVKEVRPELIGGVMIKIGDRVMDGTVAFKLQRIRQSLSHA